LFDVGGSWLDASVRTLLEERPPQALASTLKYSDSQARIGTLIAGTASARPLASPPEKLLCACVRKLAVLCHSRLRCHCGFEARVHQLRPVLAQAPGRVDRRAPQRTRTAQAPRSDGTTDE
jgi:hypothetical protein